MFVTCHPLIVEISGSRSSVMARAWPASMWCCTPSQPTPAWSPWWAPCPPSPTPPTPGACSPWSQTSWYQDNNTYQPNHEAFYKGESSWVYDRDCLPDSLLWAGSAHGQVVFRAEQNSGPLLQHPVHRDRASENNPKYSVSFILKLKMRDKLWHFLWQFNGIHLVLISTTNGFSARTHFSKPIRS